MLVAEQLSYEIIGAAMDVHRHMGPGLMESVYEQCLEHEFTSRGLKYARQMAIPLTYKGYELTTNYRIDFLVENCVILELKSVKEICEVHEAQLLTYLKLSGVKVGFIINFNVPVLKNGVLRRVL